jgi:hypothetical protein
LPAQDIIMNEDSSAPLSLHVGFTSLPASQLALLLSAMSNIYSLVADEREALAGAFELAYPPPDYLEYLRTEQDSELCLDFARTGNSIDFRFSGRRTAAGAKRGTLGNRRIQVILATVGAIIALAGQGQVIYDRHADSEMQRQIDKEFSVAEIDRIRAETEEIRHRMHEKPAQTAPSQHPHQGRRHKAIAKNVNIIQRIINAPNITVVTINGVPLKQEAPGAGDTPDTDGHAP